MSKVVTEMVNDSCETRKVRTAERGDGTEMRSDKPELSKVYDEMSKNRFPEYGNFVESKKDKQISPKKYFGGGENEQAKQET